MILFPDNGKTLKITPCYHRIAAYLPLLIFFLTIPEIKGQDNILSIPEVITAAREAAVKSGIPITDLSDLLITDSYRSAHNGITHVYLQQRFSGIPIYNALSGIHFDRTGKSVYFSGRFLSDLASRIDLPTPRKDAGSALIATLDHLDIPPGPIPVLPRSNAPIRLENKGWSRSPIPIELIYLPQPDNHIKLCWQVGIHDPRNQDYHVVFVDASDGNILNTFNRTIYCHFGSTTENSACADSHLEHNYRQVGEQASTSMPSDLASYRIFPLPLESPADGAQILLVNPAEPTASPFGWHDVNGISGAEYTTTRGNNVFAFLDRDDDDAPDGVLPDGGPELIFDFPFSNTVEPTDQTNPIVTQLFYLNNAIHDMAYQYGFNEVAGNFQENNYKKGGRERDGIFAQAQDGGGVNNANFLTLPDGEPGVMQMYLWTPSNDFLLRVDSPSNISGLLQTGGASFGPLISSKKISGLVVPVIDSVRSNLACSSISNIADVRGNIALITRGTCTFKEKTLRAAQAGAIGVIIANNQDQILTMGGDNAPPTPNIPAVLIKSSDATRIQTEINLGISVNATIGFHGNGPALRDASMDNGIVAHEYAHGISNRLTAGPSKVDCLFNDEAMGEGWSDFFTLITTAKPDQSGTQAKGIGTYSVRQSSQGSGIRRMPYSTDLKINNQTYKDIIGTRPASATTRVPHPVGEIWTAILWDIYWAMSDRYGWDPDLLKGKGGNNQAIQLVMDGMKLQPCNPGFTDGRDAILAADLINNNGVNQCLIWEAFARRGIGFSARQGSTDDRNDGIQAFDLPPVCRNTLELHKSSTPTVQAGEVFEVTLQVNNYKSTPVSNIQIHDLLPENTFFAGSVTGADRDSAQNKSLWFEIDSLAAGASRKITYQLRTAADQASISTFSDDMENGPSNWTVTATKGTNSWTLGTPISATAGKFSWNIPAMLTENDHSLQLSKPLEITGKKPVLRFFHRYFTQDTYDGGIVEYALEGSDTWNVVPDSLIFRQPYARPMVNNAFGVARVNGFSGAGPQSFQASYLNFSPFIGEKIRIRFRFATNQEPAGRGGLTLPGWSVDLVELMNIVNYTSEACLSTKEGDRVCTTSREWGTIAEPSLTPTPVVAVPAAGNFRVFPNPARDVIYIQGITSQNNPPESVSLFAFDGRKVIDWYPDNTSQIALSLRGIAAGVYFVRIATPETIYMEKIVVH